MDADQWQDAFERTKKNEGVQAAAEELIKGLRRELQSRIQREKPRTLEGIGEILVDVEKIWVRVAQDHPQTVKPEGFRATTYKDRDMSGPSFEKALKAVGAAEGVPSLDGEGKEAA